MWLRGLLEELGVKNKQGIELNCDNKIAMHIAPNPIYHERTKHIEIDCHFVREKIREGLVGTRYVVSKEQLANLMTKSLGIQQHEYLVSKLGVKDIYHLPT